MKLAIETTDRSPAQEKDLLDYAIEICEDKMVRQWLRANAAAFLSLITMFNLVRNHVEEKKKKRRRRKMDIVFVAHGAIEDETHPAVCLVPVPTIRDVLLYSPWNCAIDARAAYGIATGSIQPQHREFICNCPCKRNKSHDPRILPDGWNSMKNTGARLIPKIMVQSLEWPEDGAWEAFIELAATHGEPDSSRIVIPFLSPVTITVPFYVVTLAVGLALFFSGYKATVHLAACLCDDSGQKFSPRFLEDQYSYTIDDSAMTSSEYMSSVQYPGLYTALQALFDNV